MSTYDWLAPWPDTPLQPGEHTPGPWQVDSGQHDIPFRIWDTRHYCLGALRRMPGDGETEANARLIAAAPDMLEALENLENDDGTTMPPSAWALVQNAIAKARGLT